MNSMILFKNKEQEIHEFKSLSTRTRMEKLEGE